MKLVPENSRSECFFFFLFFFGKSSESVYVIYMKTMFVIKPGFSTNYRPRKGSRVIYDDTKYHIYIRKTKQNKKTKQTICWQILNTLQVIQKFICIYVIFAALCFYIALIKYILLYFQAEIFLQCQILKIFKNVQPSGHSAAGGRGLRDQCPNRTVEHWAVLHLQWLSHLWVPFITTTIHTNIYIFIHILI